MQRYSLSSRIGAARIAGTLAVACSWATIGRAAPPVLPQPTAKSGAGPSLQALQFPSPPPESVKPNTEAFHKSARYIAAWDALRDSRVRDSILLFRPLAQHGDARSEAFLGYMLSTEKQTIPEAQTWLEKSIAQKETYASVILGGLYLDGTIHVEDGQAKGLRVIESVDPQLRKLADSGDSLAQFYVGMFYLSGSEYPHDDAIAADWIGKAAAQDLAIAQMTLAELYLRGTGVKQDGPQGIELARKAAAHGGGAPNVYLGQCLHDGRGTPVDSFAASMRFALPSTTITRKRNACWPDATRMV